MLNPNLLLTISINLIGRLLRDRSFSPSTLTLTALGGTIEIIIAPERANKPTKISASEAVAPLFFAKTA